MCVTQGWCTTMDPDHGLHITDGDITESKPFDGHGPEYGKWPRSLWKDPSKGRPDEDVGHNAFHIKYLALVMVANDGWVGPPLKLRKCGNKVLDGNHRYRAVKFLRDVCQIFIDVPIEE